MSTILAESDTWTVSPTSLTVVGTPTYAGRYTRIGNRVFGEIQIDSTVSTASTVGVTTFNLPYTPSAFGVANGLDFGTGTLTGAGLCHTDGKLYAPTWTATPSILLAFSFITSDPF